MIVLNLRCDSDHRFEGWFRSTEDFDAQNAQGRVECPMCATTRIGRLPSGPHVRRSQAAAPSAPETTESRQARLLGVLRKMIRDSEDVGERFPEEARRIHYQEAPARSIRGVASREEAHELSEEGIDMMLLPIPSETDLH